MKLNSEQLKALTNESDEKMWQSLRQIASQHGIELPCATPSHTDMQKLRSILSGEVKISMGDAMRLINSYKKR